MFKWVSTILLTIGITLLASRGFVIKELYYIAQGETNEISWTQVLYNTRVNVEGIVFTSLGLIGIICIFVIIIIGGRKK